jgi:hypothetical protein
MGGSGSGIGLVFTSDGQEGTMLGGRLHRPGRRFALTLTARFPYNGGPVGSGLFSRGRAVTTNVAEHPEAIPRARPGEPPGAGRWLALWVGLVIALNGLLWLSGERGAALAAAVERGAARTELARVGEVGEEVIRKAVHLQQESVTFWATLAALGDFAGEPMLLVLRALLVATAFTGLAALVGRPTRFSEGLAACAAAQGIWVLGLAVRLGLMAVLHRAEVETSATLLLPPGAYSAATWVALRQLDIFAALGWTTLALGGWRRGQVNLATAFAVCGLFWSGEAAMRISYSLFLGAGMRLTLLPA